MLGAAALAGIPLLAAASDASAQTAIDGSVALNPADSTRNLLSGQSASVLPIAIQAVPGQTANLQEWRNSSGDPLAVVEPDGRISRPATGAGHAPFGWEVGGQHFLNGAPRGDDSSGGAVYDPVSYFGYNVGNYGIPPVAGEPSAAWVIEADYQDDTPVRTMEQYIDQRSADGSVGIRPLFFQTKRDATSNESFLTLAEIWGNPLDIKTPVNGVSDPANPGVQLARFAKNNTELFAVGSSDNILHIYAGAGRYSKLMLGANGVRDNYRFETAGNNSMDVTVAGQTMMRLYGFPSGGGAVAFGGVADNSAALVAKASNNGSRAIVGRGASSSQAAPLLEVQDSQSRPLSGFDKDGYFFTNRNSAPADSAIATGQALLWFNATASSPALMIKARDANGRIQSAAIKLSPGA
jgi:hypothetical protein